MDNSKFKAMLNYIRFNAVCDLPGYDFFEDITTSLDDIQKEVLCYTLLKKGICECHYGSVIDRRNRKVLFDFIPKRLISEERTKI